MKIVLFGPGPQFKGGISNYNTSLARTLARFPNAEVHIVSWTQQYPAIIPRDFIDRASKVDLLAGVPVPIQYITNYNNPFTWRQTADYILSLKPDILLIQWTITLQGLPIGWFLDTIRKRSQTEIIFDLHNVSQKENSVLDKYFSRYALQKADTFIAHSYSMANELQALLPETKFIINETGERAASGEKTIIKLYHPVYDLFAPIPSFDKEAEKEKLKLKGFVFLFFGFIRKYKGLHNIIPAFAKVAAQRPDVSLLIAGESFWQTLDQSKLSTRVKSAVFAAAKSIFLKKGENEQDYRPLELIAEYGLQDRVTVVNEFIPNEDVSRYFQVSDALTLYYTTSVPSGVESIAYNFGTPILATRLGHFPETIIPGYNGYLAEPDNIDDMAAQMLLAIDQPIDSENVRETGRRFSWENYAKKILKIEN